MALPIPSKMKEIQSAATQTSFLGARGTPAINVWIDSMFIGSSKVNGSINVNSVDEPFPVQLHHADRMTAGNDIKMALSMAVVTGLLQTFDDLLTTPGRQALEVLIR
jgi:hypothetical protein